MQRLNEEGERLKDIRSARHQFQPSDVVDVASEEEDPGFDEKRLNDFRSDDEDEVKNVASDDEFAESDDKGIEELLREDDDEFKELFEDSEED